MNSKMYFGDAKFFDDLGEFIQSIYPNFGRNFGNDNRKVIRFRWRDEVADKRDWKWVITKGVKKGNKVSYNTECGLLFERGPINAFKKHFPEGNLTKIYLDASACMMLEPTLMEHLCSAYSYQDGSDANGDDSITFELSSVCNTMFPNSFRSLRGCSKLNAKISKETVQFIQGILKSSDFVSIDATVQTECYVGNDVIYSGSLEDISALKEYLPSFVADTNRISPNVKGVFICKGVANAILRGYSYVGRGAGKEYLIYVMNAVD